jgi:ribose/xylose/arabinose/galactoside ABC-type transport system permease subunit
VRENDVSNDVGIARQVEPTTVPDSTLIDAKLEPTAPSTVGQWMVRYSLVLVFLAVVGFFSLANPDTFLTWSNARSILDQSAPLVLVATGLTLVLVMREFDLSFGAVAGLGAAVSVQLMAGPGMPTWLAVLLALAATAAVGLVNGVLVSVVGVPSFITTLAMSSVVAGIEKAIANTTIFEGITPGFLDLTRDRIMGIPMAVVIALLAATVVGLVLRSTVFGRHSVAIGDNPAAARIAGVNIRRIQLINFTVCALLAGLAGLLLASRAASYYPNPGQGLLLPAFAATFLSLSLGGGWRFNVFGAVLGAIFLGTITTGLTMMDQPAWVALVVQGVLLLAAVVSLAIRTRRK